MKKMIRKYVKRPIIWKKEFWHNGDYSYTSTVGYEIGPPRPEGLSKVWYCNGPNGEFLGTRLTIAQAKVRCAEARDDSVYRLMKCVEMS